MILKMVFANKEDTFLIKINGICGALLTLASALIFGG